MRDERDLRHRLASIDGRGYPACKGLAGVWALKGLELSIDHVQGDPFAAPSQLSAFVPRDATGIDDDLVATTWRRTAVEDCLLRRFSRALARVDGRVRGSGSSGRISTAAIGPEVYPRSACEIVADGVIVRFVAGFPAHGRTIDGRALERMLCELIPRAIIEALVLDGSGERAVRDAAHLADDQHALRQALEPLGLVGFIADGSVLPRASGDAAAPLAGAVPMAAPASLACEIDLPHRGRVRGLGVRRGITLIVGGGYHGKSTLLKALQEGVYDHVAGDGRELAVCDASALKVRAEDGRPVHAVNIDPFISHLPDGRDTRAFSSVDASGSTSQAAAVMEGIEAGARVLLLDEDTSATNFLVRDDLMAEVVAAEHEPITPFSERVRALSRARDVSVVMVVGSSGAFFPVADQVILMDAYHAFDATERVRATCRAHGLSAGTTAGAAGGAMDFDTRSDARLLRLGEPAPRPRASGRGATGLRVRVQGLDGFSVGGGSVDTRRLEQLVDGGQTEALALIVRLMMERGLLDGSMSLAHAAEAAWDLVWRGGWDVLAPRGAVPCGLALPRPQELYCCLNRWRPAPGAARG